MINLEKGAKPMNAIQFIKENGVDKAREVVEDAPEKATVVSAETYGYFYKYQDSPVWRRVYRRKDGVESSCTWFSPIRNPIELSDLKRLIESFDLINSLGGVQEATNKAFDMTMLVVGFNPDKIEQAIADYEAIYSIPQSVKKAILNLEMHL